MKLVSVALCFCAVFLFPVADARADDNLLVGAWSYRNNRGPEAGPNTIPINQLFQFHPDGNFSHRFTQPGSDTTYFGQYQLAPDNTNLQLYYQDYNPKQWPPAIAPGSRFSVQIHFQSEMRFELMDRSGPMLFIRNQ